jgi:hypothetical protein
VRLGVHAVTEHHASPLYVGERPSPTDPHFAEDERHGRVPLDVIDGEQIGHDLAGLVGGVRGEDAMTSSELVSLGEVRELR